MTSLNVVQKLIEDIKIAAAANSLYLHRYQTNGGNHATRITYALHHSVERPMRSDQCSHWRVSISQNEGDYRALRGVPQADKINVSHRKMTPSEQCKAAGLRSLADLARMVHKPPQTLRNWHRDSPELFAIVVAGAAQRYGCYLDAANKIERLQKVMQQVLIDAQSQDALPEWWTVMQQTLDA